MEIYKRKVGYEDLNYRIINSGLPITASSYLITATTLYFPVMLTQNFEDIGLYTDTENPVYEIVDFSGIWNLSNTGGGVAGQTPCLILNNCNVSFTSVPITYYNANNGSISALITGCPGPQTIQWSGPNGFTSTNLTINSLTSGNYTLKITDANCNISYASYFLTQPQSLSAILLSNNSQTNVTSPGGCNGTANVIPSGGQPPYTYTWYSFIPPAYTATTTYAGPSTTLTGLTSLCAGQYSVQIKDASNTIVSQFFTITEPTAISGSVVSTVGVSCAGGNTGALTVSASGGIHPTGYTFVLSGPVTGIITGNTGNATFSNLLSGNYNVQVFDNVGNTITIGPINITAPSAVNLTANYKDSGCYGSTTGFVTFTPSGGVSPYNLSISKNSAISVTPTVTGPYTLSNLGPGTYQCTITDANGCAGPTQTVTIKQRPQLNVSVATPNKFNGYNILCFSATTAITVTTSYTSDPTTYPVPANTIRIYLNNVLRKTLSPGPGTTTITGITAGNYTVTAVDSATAGHPPPGFFLNCSATTTVTLTQPPMPLSFVGSPNIDIISGITGCVAGSGNGPCCQGIINVNGGVAPYNVTWTMTPGNTPWGVGITSNPFFSNMTTPNYTTLTVRVTDANGCVITATRAV